MRLEIRHTWNGETASDHEAAVVDVSRRPDGDVDVSIDAPYHGDPPPEANPGSVPGLWAYEVVELFIVGPDERYLEVELGPHGHHLVLQLQGRRQVTASGLSLPYSPKVEGGENRWTARVSLPAAWLPPGPHTGNAFAIHGLGPARRYLCATPTMGDRPDFHRLELFLPLVL